MILNVGCGSDSRGDVRLDIHKTEAANIVADAQYLPFRSRCFDSVVCISVLEHIPSWIQALQEMIRVSKDELMLEVPVNSDLRKTEVLRLLFPSKSNLKLFFNMPQRARETFWQLDPFILAKSISKYGFHCVIQRIHQWYAGIPSRCWRIYGWRNLDEPV